MKAVDRVRHVLAITIHHVNLSSTPAEQTEVTALRRRFIDLAVGLDLGRVSPLEGSLQLDALETSLLRLWARLHPSTEAAELPPHQAQRVG